VVIDGGKALRAAVNSVFGRMAVVQRCQIHYAEQRIMPSRMITHDVFPRQAWRVGVKSSA